VDLGSQRDDLRDNLIARYNAGTNQTESRSFVLRDVTENAATRDANYNAAFVQTEYFSYLRRDPDRGGYDYWLNVITNREVGNYRGMCARLSRRRNINGASAQLFHTATASVGSSLDVRQTSVCRCSRENVLVGVGEKLKFVGLC
jgi:hypothetical protein